jgi:hypothetical protein
MHLCATSILPSVKSPAIKSGPIALTPSFNHFPALRHSAAPHHQHCYNAIAWTSAYRSDLYILERSGMFNGETVRLHIRAKRVGRKGFQCKVGTHSAAKPGLELRIRLENQSHDQNFIFPGAAGNTYQFRYRTSLSNAQVQFDLTVD